MEPPATTSHEVTTNLPGDPTVLAPALAMGEAVGAFFRRHANARLDPSVRAPVAHALAGLAAGSAAAGLGLWAVAVVAGRETSWRRLGCSITGVSLGVLKSVGRPVKVAGGEN